MGGYTSLPRRNPLSTERAFDRAMVAVYKRAKQEAGYNATRFLQMLSEHGGVETAHQLLLASGVSDGFTALWKAGRLDLSVEYHVLLEEFHELFTEDEREIATVRVAKSESRETTFDQDLVGIEPMLTVLERLTGELCSTLARQDRRGRTIGIKIRLADFSTHTRARSLAAPVNEATVVGGVAADLLREFDPRRPVRLLGVRVAGLDEARPGPTAADAQQLELATQVTSASSAPCRSTGTAGRCGWPR